MKAPRKEHYAILLFTIVIFQFISVQRVLNSTAESTSELVFLRPQHVDIDLDIKNEVWDPPTKIVVWGEHASGAAYAAKVLGEAFGSSQTTLHEHLFRHDLFHQDELNDIANKTDILWIMAVRSPCDWADALIRLQSSELSGTNGGRVLSAEEYYRMPWADWGGTDVSDPDGPDQSSKYHEDIFKLRMHKLTMMTQIMTLVPRHVKILRLNEFERNPHVLVEEIVKEYQMKPMDDYEPYPPSKKIHSTVCMGYGEWKEAQRRIDWKMEGYFGYFPGHCHLCYGANPTTILEPDSNKIENEYSKSRQDSRHEADYEERYKNKIPNVKLSDAPPAKIYLLGERNSGTTFVSTTLAEAFELPHDFPVQSVADQFAIDIPVLLHKHMFRHDLLNEKEIAEIKTRKDILWVMVVRPPCEWIEGMYRKPYHLCPQTKPEKCRPESGRVVWLNQNDVAKISLKEFFSEMKWKDWPESNLFERKKGNKRTDNQTIAISKVSKNYTYPNVIALRKHKLKLMKQIISAVPRNVKIVRLKEVERNPDMFIQDLVKEFDLSMKEGYQPPQPSKVTHKAACFTPDEWETAQKIMDWELEGEFGFNPFDCRMCYGYDRSLSYSKRRDRNKKTKEILNAGSRRD